MFPAFTDSRECKLVKVRLGVGTKAPQHKSQITDKIYRIIIITVIIITFIFLCLIIIICNLNLPL